MIKLRKEENIYILYLDNKPVNALSKEFVYELLKLIDEISTDNNLRGLIIMSSLKHFSAGADLKERSLMTKEESIDAVYMIKSLIVKILLLMERLPFIKAVGGKQYGFSLFFDAASKTILFSAIIEFFTTDTPFKSYLAGLVCISYLTDQ